MNAASQSGNILESGLQKSRRRWFPNLTGEVADGSRKVRERLVDFSSPPSPLSHPTFSSSSSLFTASSSVICCFLPLVWFLGRGFFLHLLPERLCDPKVFSFLLVPMKDLWVAGVTASISPQTRRISAIPERCRRDRLGEVSAGDPLASE